MSKYSETDLYPPIKKLLESQGYKVKAEIGAVDVMGVKENGASVIIELKLGFSLALIHQCVNRQAVSDDVYMAIEQRSGKRFLKSVKDMKALCRRLGLGLMTVRLKDSLVQIHCDPAPFKPQKSKKRQAVLLKEFQKRIGDPNDGGQMRKGLVTAYRQDAMKIADYLKDKGPSKGADVARETGVENATRMMYHNHYGWFEKIQTGIYQLSEKGKA